MTERNISFKVSEDFYKKVKVQVALEGITLKDYIISLIEKDLETK